MTNRNELEQKIRPIHYLGSKLRILELINSAIEMVSPTDGCVCDLFAGSGTVSKYLSITRSVVSVDIQEYSRVLCSALLRPVTDINIDSFLYSCINSKHYKSLLWSIRPMIEHESNCIKQASRKDAMPLCELIEKGSIISYEQGYTMDCSSDLKHALQNTLSRLKELNFLAGPEALVVRYFGGLYFSYLQATQIDALLEEIAKLNEKDKDTFLAAVLSTASDVVNTVGKQFAQPIKPRNSDGSPKMNLVEKIHKDRGLEVYSVFQKWLNIYYAQEKSKFNHTIYKMDYSDALDIINDVKVVYADPPYTRYHYSRYYHVLETICLRDNPKISKTCLNGGKNISRGIYRADRHQSPFCIKSQSAAAFENLFKKVRSLESALVLSYSPFDNNKKAAPRLELINHLEKMAKKYFKSVKVISIADFSHSKLNKANKNFEVVDSAELLIVCQIS